MVAMDEQVSYWSHFTPFGCADCRAAAGLVVSFRPCMGALSSCCRAAAGLSWRAVNGAWVDAQPLTHAMAIPIPIQSICRGFIGGSPLPLVGRARGLLFHPFWGHCSRAVAALMPYPHSCLRTSGCTP